MSLMKKIFHQAEKTFSSANKEVIKANLLILKRLLDSMEFVDLMIDPYFASKQAFQRKVRRLTSPDKTFC